MTNTRDKMECSHENRMPVAIDYETVDASGDEITLKNVIAEACPHCDEIIVDIDELTQREQLQLAKKFGIKPRHIPILLFLYSPGPRFARDNPIKQKYTFNKMLFYLFKKLEEKGFGESFIHDQIECLERGPVPKNLYDDAEELEKEGLIDVQEGGKKQQRPYVYDLTEEGEKMAEKLWEKVPKIVDDTVVNVKQRLLLLDSTQLKEKVHEDYPEYRELYT